MITNHVLWKSSHIEPSTEGKAVDKKNRASKKVRCEAFQKIEYNKIEEGFTFLRSLIDHNQSDTSFNFYPFVKFKQSINIFVNY